MMQAIEKHFPNSSGDPRMACVDIFQITQQRIFHEKKRDRLPYVLVTSAMLIAIAIIFYPLFRTIIDGFSNYILYKPNEQSFSDLANYRIAFNDPLFYSSLLNMLIWMISIIAFLFLLIFATALLLNRNFKGRGIARSLILIPWIITNLLWRWMYDGNYSLITQILFRLGPIDHLIPFLAIMFLAGLHAIPTELNEAAKIDGANK